MCLTCGCLLPDKRYGEEHLITMQDLLDAASADDATVEQAWKNMMETMDQLMAGKVNSTAWKPSKRYRQSVII